MRLDNIQCFTGYLEITSIHPDLRTRKDLYKLTSVVATCLPSYLHSDLYLPKRNQSTHAKGLQRSHNLWTLVNCCWINGLADVCEVEELFYQQSLTVQLTRLILQHYHRHKCCPSLHKLVSLLLHTGNPHLDLDNGVHRHLLHRIYN
jgi:hypothetical protein